MGGLVKYALRDGSNITQAWLLEHVVPNMAAQFLVQFAVTLALPIVWACFDSECSIPIPLALKNRVWQAYEAIRDPNNLPGDQNPVEKHHIVIVNDNGTLLINKAGQLTNLSNPPNDAMHGMTVLQLEQELRNVTSQLTELMHSINQLQASGQQNEAAWQQMAALNRKVGQMNTAIQQFATFPVVRLPAQQQQLDVVTAPDHNGDNMDDNVDGNNGAAATPIPFECTLSQKPQNLYELRQEYEYGIGSRKATKYFTSHERGWVKSTYAKCNIVWMEILHLIHGGETHLVASDQILNVYGPTLSMTEFIGQIQKDSKTGVHPALQV